MTGETADISSLRNFEWFQWLWYRDTKAPYPNDSKVLVRYLGPAKSIGPEMCMHLLKSNGRVIQRTTVGPITPVEFATEGIKHQMEEYMTAIYRGPLGDPMSTSTLEDSNDNLTATPSYPPYSDDINGDSQTMPEMDSFTLDAFDKYVGAQLDLPLQDAMTSATVVARKRDPEGNPIGRLHNNPLLDTRVYDVRFPDGSVEDYAANVIAENMYAQVNDEG